MTRSLRVLARVGLVGSLLVVLSLTLSPHNIRTEARGHGTLGAVRHGTRLPNTPLGSRSQGTDIVNNVLLFIPLGLFGLLAVPRRPIAVAATGVALSAAIEVTQGLFLPNRDGSVRDVVTNSTGLLIGIAIGGLIIRTTTRSAERDA